MGNIEQTAIGQPSGHPKGLFYLSFTEMWERFSFYGMSALLTLYMVKELLLPENAAQVIGLATLRNLFEFRGPMSDVAFSAIIYGWYAGLVYFTPIVGGWVADRILGAKRTVMLGVILMSAGHLAMSFYASFLFALLLLILGSGFLKGNISAQVGALYPQSDESMRSRGFTIFSTGICIGAASGPLVTGLVAAVYGWHAGFAVAAVLMLVALLAYILGQRHLPDDRPLAGKREKSAPMTKAERKRLWILLLIIALTIPAEIAYPMVWSIGILWVDQYVNLATSLGEVPSSWFASMDSIGAILAAPALVMFWAWQAKRGIEPSSVTKVGIGSAIIAFAALLFAYGNMGHSGPDSVNAGWAIAGWLIMGLAWMYYWPTTLAIVSRAAPAGMASILMGVAFLSPFIGHVLAGWIGSYFDQMHPSVFWAMDAAIALAGGILILLFRKRLQAALESDLAS
ncbi:peptide MFS transporter [Sphingorhabdus wooponensis]|uniref:MFS transporter n=1 Tax=Sphingorhabdus wooponensis TaxID=940136 RepID=A0A3R8QAE9_9SPHN|nr:peptide MFS transporter [Sphingorhabdus wooponensis]RRQ52672.1 MFS transporter [Sphingorhabdus wooponensis]